jgi:hypothetical protein
MKARYQPGQGFHHDLHPDDVEDADSSPDMKNPNGIILD